MEDIDYEWVVKAEKVWESSTWVKVWIVHFDNLFYFVFL